MTTRSFPQAITRDPRSVPRLIRDGAILVALALSLLAPSAALADGCAATERLAAHAGQSRSHRSIVLLEGRDPAHVTRWSNLHADMSPSDRSIVKIESKDPANFPATVDTTGWNNLHAGMSRNHRSIVQIEGQDPANFPATVLAC